MKFGIHPESGLPTVEAAGEPRVLACLPPRPGPCRLPPFGRPLIPRGDWREWGLGAWCPEVYDQDGQGSCLPAGTRVRMADGSQKPIERVRLLDEVLTAEGNLGAVTKLFVRRDVGSLVRIQLWGHGHLRATDEHPVLTRRGYVEARELRLGDWVAMPRYLPCRQTSLQSAAHAQASRWTMKGDRRIHFAGVVGRKAVEASVRALPDMIRLTRGAGRIFGLFLAEGSTDTHKVVWTFAAAEETTLAAELVRLLREEWDVEGHVQKRGNGSVKVCVYGRLWARLFESLCSTGAGHKRLHPDLAAGPREFMEAMLEGWLDGDGYERRTTRQGNTVSHDLALAMYDIAQALGRRPAIRYSEPKVSHGVKRRMPRWDVEMGTGGDDTYRCQLEEKHIWRKVRGLLYEPFAGPVFNMEVEGDNSYVAEGIGVHNCVGHGAVAGFAVSFARSGQRPRRFSPCFVYAQINGGADRGAVVADALDELRQTGVCLESTVGPGRIWKRDLPAAAYDEAKRYRVEQAYQLRSFDEVVAATLLGFPVVFGVEIGQRFEPDADGFVPDRAGGGGGHCMCGVGPRQRGGRWYLTTLNSWSRRWGAGGYCHLPESYFDGDVDAFAVQAAREDDRDDDEPPAGAN